MTTYLRLYEKLLKLHFSVLLYSNCREKVLKIMGNIGQIWDWFLGLSTRDWITTIHWNIVMTILRKPLDMWLLWKFLELHFNISFRLGKYWDPGKRKYVIEYAYKFSFSKIGCTVARRPKKSETILLNFLYCQIKEIINVIWTLI